MLNNVQRVLANVEGELECRLEPEKFKFDGVLGVEVDYLAILKDFLLSRKHTGEHFKCVVLRVQLESPNVLLLGATQRHSLNAYLLMVLPTSLISKY